jgi:hypothetical protein
LEVPDPLPCGDPLRGVLVRMLAPAPSERFQSARAARAALTGGALRPANVVAAERTGVRAVTSHGWEPVPRQLTGSTREQFRKVAYTPWQLLDSENKHGKPSVMDRGVVLFFSVLTIGILPMIIWGRAYARKKRLKPFFRNGLPARATILEMAREEVEFGAKLARVRYEFEADGARHRGSDWVLTTYAERWDTGDTIEVLYLPDEDYDSVIVSTR